MKSESVSELLTIGARHNSYAQDGLFGWELVSVIMVEDGGQARIVSMLRRPGPSFSDAARKSQSDFIMEDTKVAIQQRTALEQERFQERLERIRKP